MLFRIMAHKHCTGPEMGHNRKQWFTVLAPVHVQCVQYTVGVFTN